MIRLCHTRRAVKILGLWCFIGPDLLVCSHCILWLSPLTGVWFLLKGALKSYICQWFFFHGVFYTRDFI